MIIFTSPPKCDFITSKEVMGRIKCILIVNGCGQNFGVVSPDSQGLWEAHMKEMVGNGDYSHMGYGTEQREVWIVDKEAWDETGCN